MTPILRLAALLALATAAGCAAPPAALSPAASGTTSAGWTLAWSDEFDGKQLDRTKWVAETGGHGWGNKELQHYTDRPENLRVAGGHLVIEARKEGFGDNDYTSARIKTAGLMEQMHGRFEARIKVPKGQGI